MQIDFSEISGNAAYHLMVQTLIPRPIAWVLSDNGNETYNLAPFSYFMGVTGDPPTFAISVGHKPEGTCKDTWVNIRDRSHFVIHIPSCGAAQLVAKSAATMEHGESEVSALGLSVTDFPGSSLPRLKDCQVAFALERDQIIEVGKGPQALILGVAHHVYVSDSIATAQGKRTVIDPTKLDPLARLGGNFYAGLGDLFEVKRPP